MGLKAYAGVARAPFLLLPLTLIAAGTGAASLVGGADFLRAAVALLGLTGMHAAVNALNEWSDHRTRIDFRTARTPFSGGSGTLPAGHLPPRSALVVVAAGTTLGLAAAALFVVEVGWPIVPILAVGAFSVFAYTDLLARLGVGEVFAGLGLGGLPVIGAALVQAHTVPPAAFAAAVPAFCMTFNLLLLNEFPDEEADRAGGRRNLVLLLRRRIAGLVYAAAALAVPVWIALCAALRILPPAALAGAAPSVLLIGPLRFALAGAQGAVPVSALGANVAWNLLTNLALGAALFLSAVC